MEGHPHHTEGVEKCDRIMMNHGGRNKESVVKAERKSDGSKCGPGKATTGGQCQPKGGGFASTNSSQPSDFTMTVEC
jgi:hypothetical protein